jgi:hypothetical protein
MVADKKTKAPLAGCNDSIRNVSGQLSSVAGGAAQGFTL